MWGRGVAGTGRGAGLLGGRARWARGEGRDLVWAGRGGHGERGGAWVSVRLRLAAVGL